jgi:site-specific recombinase XerD
MIGEARRNGMIGQEEAADLTDIPNIQQKGTQLGNWLTREQAKELLAVPDRSTFKGKRDYVILALLVGCALRRNELAELDVETIQQREGRWVLADLEGKGRRILITTSDFTTQARAFAAQSGIELINFPALMKLFEESGLKQYL